MAHRDVSKTVVHQIKGWFPACIDSPGVNMAGLWCCVGTVACRVGALMLHVQTQLFLLDSRERKGGRAGH